jgi:hypothetical protein
VLTYESIEFLNKLKQALDYLESRFSLTFEEMGGDGVDPRASEFDPADYEDNEIGPTTTLSVSLPRSDDYLDTTYGDFLALIQELKSAELIGNLECWTSKRLIVRVEPASASAYVQVEKLDGENSFEVLKHETTINGVDVSCSITTGTTAFGFLVYETNDWDKYHPPTLSEDLFVEVKFSDAIEKTDARMIANAYIFELSSSVKLDLVLAPRPYMWLDGDADDEKEISPGFRLRPLLVGRGLESLLALYNKGLESHDAEIQILYFTKVIEYVSQTVNRKHLTESVTTKLLTRRALDPDAGFVVELEGLFDELKLLRQDREAIKQTVSTCCDAIELSLLAPPFLRILASISSSTKAKDRESALNRLGEAIASTRNSIAHAKANYNPRGDECPIEELDRFAKCIRLTAEQTVRWYASQPERTRIA